MLAANPEYQRGVVWSQTQKKKLIDSLMRGYPLPIIYLHHIKRGVSKYARDDFEIIDGQQRLNAIYEFSQGAFPLFDPKKDEAVARFPAFIRDAPCPWAGKRFSELSEELQHQFKSTELSVAHVETDQVNEVRDLFVRLQSGLPLNHQETRDAWPGNFTDFILRLGGKPELARYPGHPLFTSTLGMKPGSDRGKTRQLAAQLSMLILSRRGFGGSSGTLCDINADAVNRFYYDNLDFDVEGQDAQRIFAVLNQLHQLLAGSKRPKLHGHDAIHAALLIDALSEEYAPSWQDQFPAALDRFSAGLAEGKKANQEGKPHEYWSMYAQWTRVNSDRFDVIERRHRFYVEQMMKYMQPLKLKDPNRLFGELDRTVLFYRQNKCCAVCDGSMNWEDVEVHHVEEHYQGGPTTLENGAAVHKACHPKGPSATQAFYQKFKAKQAQELAAQEGLDKVIAELLADA